MIIFFFFRRLLAPFFYDDQPPPLEFNRLCTIVGMSVVTATAFSQFDVFLF